MAWYKSPLARAARLAGENVVPPPTGLKGLDTLLATNLFFGLVINSLDMLLDIC